MDANGTGWRWWGGYNEEWCTYGPHDTREDVIAEAVADRMGEFQDDDGKWKLGVHVCEARQDPLRLVDWIDDADWFLERAEERLSESDRVGSEYDEGPWFECSREQQADLEARIKRACAEWQEAHGLVFICQTFSASRNHGHVVVDLPDEETA